MTVTLQQPVYNNVPDSHINAHEVTKGAILTPILRRLEDELVRRGIVPKDPSATFYPLWFLAETERNVFLWRQQLSLSDAQKFEFWIDPFALIEKRRRQIEKGGEQTSFGLSAPKSDLSDELEYLCELDHQLRRIFNHAEAFSAAASQVLKECSVQMQKNCVRLP